MRIFLVGVRQLKLPRMFLTAMFLFMLAGGLVLAWYGPQDEKLVSGALVSLAYGLLGPTGFCEAYPCREMAVRGAASAGKPIVISTDITTAGVGGTFIPSGHTTITADVIRVPCYANNCGLDPETGDMPAATVTYNGYIAGFNGGRAEGYGSVTCGAGVGLGNGAYETVTCDIDNNVPQGKAFTIQWEASYYDQNGDLHWGVTAQPVCSGENGCVGRLLAGWTDFATGEGSGFYTDNTGQSFDQMVTEEMNGGGVSQTATATTSSRSTTVTQTYTSVTNGQTSVVTTTVTGIVVQEQLVPWVLSDILGAAKGQITQIGLGMAGLSAVGLVGTTFWPKKFPKLF